MNNYDNEIRKSKNTELRDWIKVIISIIGVVASVVTVSIGIFQFLENKNRVQDSLYQEALFKILSDDLSQNKIGLGNIIKYKYMANEFAPIIIDTLLSKNEKEFNELKNYYSSACKLLYDQVYPIINEYLKIYWNNKDILQFRLQWLLLEFLRISATQNYMKNYNDLSINDGDLNNSNLQKISISTSNIRKTIFDNALFSKCKIEKTLFSECSFWMATFIKGNEIKDVNFKNCNFQDCTIDSKIENILFDSCNVAGLKVYITESIKFNKCDGIDLLINLTKN
jgi:hypothetical protein